MGFRFRRSLGLAKGLRVNFGKRGASISVGGRGATINIGKRGVTGTVGIPGTGISWSQNIVKGSSRAAKKAAPTCSNVSANTQAQIADSLRSLILSDYGKLQNYGSSFHWPYVLSVRIQPLPHGHFSLQLLVEDGGPEPNFSPGQSLLASAPIDRMDTVETITAKLLRVVNWSLFGLTNSQTSTGCVGLVVLLILACAAFAATK